MTHSQVIKIVYLPTIKLLLILTIIHYKINEGIRHNVFASNERSTYLLLGELDVWPVGER